MIDDQAILTFLIVYSCFLAIFPYILISGVIYRRQHYITVQRPLSTLINEAFAISFYGIISAIYLAGYMACNVSFVLQFFVFVLLANGLIYRAFYFLMKYRINTYFSEIAKPKNLLNNISKDSWFIQNRGLWESWKPFVVVLTTTTTILLAISFGIMGATNYYEVPFSECVKIVSIIAYGILILLVIIFGKF